HPEIPPNTGNIGRSCIGVGAKLWLVKPLGFQMDEKALRRAGMDYWKHVDCEVVEDWEHLTTRLSHVPADRFWYLTKFAEKLVWDAEFQRGDVLVFGSESSGLPDQLRQDNSDNCVKLPMKEAIRSLNLASTANTIMYEAVRQFGGLD
ncbi:UNVERIFIED_CONTAM: hypothetical protein GTU68_057056, partial [Idotea baltica]|nr:hypothetical protein [Idotea baltica]